MKEIKVHNSNLAYSFDLENIKDKYVSHILTGLKPKNKTRNAESLSKDDFFIAAGIASNDEHAFHVRRKPGAKTSTLTLNIDPQHVEKARIFFKSFFAEAHKLHEKDANDPDYGKVKKLVERAAEKTKATIEILQKKEIAAEAVKEVTAKKMHTESDIFRFTYAGSSEKLLSTVADSQKTRDWVINTFNLSEPDEATKLQIENKTAKGHPKHISILDRDSEKKQLHYSCTEVNNERFTAFLVYLDKKVNSPKFMQSDWIKIFEETYAESIEFLEMKRIASSRKADIRSNKKVMENREYLQFDWVFAIGSDTPERSKYKTHFKEGKDGQHLVLYPESPYAAEVYKALEKKSQLLKYIIGDGNNGNFAIKEDSAGKKSIRLSSKLPFAEERMHILHSWMKKVITDIPDVLSMENVEIDMKALFRGIDEKMQQREREKQKTVAVAKVKEETKANHTAKIDKGVAQVFLDKLKTNLDKLKKELRLDAISISGYEVSIGSKSSVDLGNRQKEIKEFIEWMPKQTDEKIVKDIEKGMFREPLAQFKREKEAAAIKLREASYKEFTISDLNTIVKARNPEQIDLIAKLNTHLMNYVVGEAGTGKTFVVLANALKDVFDPNHPATKILIARPEITVGNKETGFLPGGEFEKLKPYLGGFMDNLMELCGEDEKLFKKLLLGEKKGENGAVRDVAPIIEVQTISYIRGRSLKRYKTIIDECQNMSYEEDAVVLKRVGRNSSMTLMGDLSGKQSDLPKEKRGAFEQRVTEEAYLIRQNEKVVAKNGGNSLDSIGFSQLIEIERSELVDNIIRIEKFRQNHRDMFNTDEFRKFAEELVKRASVKVVSHNKSNKPEPS